MDVLHVKIVFVESSKKLSPGFGGNFEKRQEGFYILTIESGDAGRNLFHELGHMGHDYLYDEPGDESLPYALEDAFTLWWQEHHGEDYNIKFIKEREENMEKVFCKDCKFILKMEIMWPLCAKGKMDYVLGKTYQVACMDKNRDGNCPDYEPKEVKDEV